MIPVTPQAKTTLILNSYHQAAGFMSARAVIRHLINGSVKGFDSEGNAVSWVSEGSAPSWSNGNVSVATDQPCLRAGHRAYAIPTIVILQNKFGYSPKKNENVSIRRLYKIYKGTCQYCLEKIPYNDATKDHWYPRDKGGSNHDFNLLLACQPCNARKGSRFPYYDVNGKEVKPKILPKYLDVNLPDDSKPRDEWAPYLHIELSLLEDNK